MALFNSMDENSTGDEIPVSPLNIFNVVPSFPVYSPIFAVSPYNMTELSPDA